MSHEEFGRRDLFKRAAAGAGAAALGASVGLPKVLAQEALASQVPRRTLGATGETIPILATGAFGGVDPEYDNVLHRGFNEGCNYFDAAQKYGNGEYHKALGNFIEQVGRENVFITSKSGMFGASVTPPEKYRDVMEAEFESLRIGGLDAYMLHGLDHIECLEPAYLKMIDDMKSRGRTRHFGFSCHGRHVVALMNKAAELGSDTVQLIMFKYNFAQYGDVELNKAIDACVNAGIGLIAMKVLMSVPKDPEEIKTFQTEGGFTLQQAKLKAVWADERITSVCVQMANTDQLTENIAAAKSPVQLTMNDVQKLRDYTFRTASLRCNGCAKHCEDRVEGDLRIADTLRYLMYSDSYGNHEDAKALYHALNPNERDFAHIDLGPATVACPQGIDIAQRLSDAAQRFV